MNASWKNPSHKSGILALVGLAALAWIKLGAGASTTNPPDIECNARDPLSRCAATPELGFPLGYGLVFTPIMDEFL
jgi:hypothetical protein